MPLNATAGGFDLRYRQEVVPSLFLLKNLSTRSCRLLSGPDQTNPHELSSEFNRAGLGPSHNLSITPYKRDIALKGRDPHLHLTPHCCHGLNHTKVALARPSLSPHHFNSHHRGGAASSSNAPFQPRAQVASPRLPRRRPQRAPHGGAQGRDGLGAYDPGDCAGRWYRTFRAW